jgi:hypothetical protein
MRPSVQVSGQHIDDLTGIAQQPYSSLQEVLNELEISQYLTSLVTNGFETWEKLLSISESDLERLKFKLGHRRKLQQKIRGFKEELLASRSRDGQHGQRRKRSLSSSSGSTCNASERTTRTSWSTLSAYTTDGLVLPCW